MAGILWTILVIVLVVWLLGLLLNFGGSLIHLLLIVAAIVLIYNLLVVVDRAIAQARSCEARKSPDRPGLMMLR